MKILIIFIITISLTLNVSAASQVDIENFLLSYTLLDNNQEMKVDADIIYATTDCEMSKAEKIQVLRFVRKFKRDVKELRNSQKLQYAIRLLANTAEYESGKKKLSDVLQGTANCQGYSMMLHELMQAVGITNELRITKNHIYNVIEGDNIDMTILYPIFRQNTSTKNYE